MRRCQGRLAHGFEGDRERAHVRDFARHEELQGVLGSAVVGKIDQPLVDDLGPRLGGDVAAQIDVEFAGDLEVIRGPGVPIELYRLTPPPPAMAMSGIGFGRLAHRTSEA